MTSRVVSLLFSLLLLAAPAAHADTHLRREFIFAVASPISKVPIRWGFSCSFPNDPKLRHDVRDGFRYWNSLVPKKVFVEEHACGTVTPINGIEVVLARVPYKLDGEAVYATAYSYPMRGQQVGGLIAFWEDWFTEKSANMRRSVSRHEVGHVILFDHNDGTPRCLMYPYINSRTTTYFDHEKSACLTELWEFRKRFGGKLP